MKPEDFGLTLKDPARPELGWKLLWERRSAAGARSSGLGRPSELRRRRPAGVGVRDRICRSSR
jgi:hypothetical protein